MGRGSEEDVVSANDVETQPDERSSLVDVVADAEVHLRRALIARYGVEVGVEATRDAVAWAWEHPGEVMAAQNPAGLLYRVGQSSSRRYRRWRSAPVLPSERVVGLPDHEPGLDDALARLGPAQRAAVLLVHGYRYSYAEVAGLLGVPVSTVRNHVHRGLKRLRTELEN